MRMSAQENHYWAKQHGPTSTSLGGAVTGGVRDNSHIYYNPGASAFTSTFNLSIQSDAFFFENIYIRNGVGKGLNTQHNSFESAPQMISLTYGFKDRPNWRTSFGYLNMTYSNVRLRAKNELKKDIYSEVPGDELFIGTWNYRHRIRENWFGFAVARKMNDNLGIGISTFATFRSYEYVQSKDQNIYAKKGGGLYQPERYIYFSDNIDGTASGMLWKLGIAYEINGFKLGLSITTPRIQLNWLSTMFLNSSQYSRPGTYDSLLDVPTYSIQYNKATSTYKSPWVIDFGLMKNFLETDIYFRVAYYSAIAPYLLITPKEQGGVSSLISDRVPGAADAWLANKEVVNVAIGWNRKYTEHFEMMAGFRTDFNYLDWNKLKNKAGFTPAISFWNIYHLSAGTNLTLLKHEFTVGLTYSWARGKGTQAFNLNPPDGDELFKYPEDNAKVYYDQIVLLIGYVYNFW